MTKTDMAHISIIVLDMMSVYFDGFILDGDMYLFEIVETFNNFIKRLCLIPTEIKTQCFRSFIGKLHLITVVFSDTVSDSLQRFIVKYYSFGSYRRHFSRGNCRVVRNNCFYYCCRSLG